MLRTPPLLLSLQLGNRRASPSDPHPKPLLLPPLKLKINKRGKSSSREMRRGIISLMNSMNPNGRIFRRRRRSQFRGRRGKGGI
jgi:hypothetical protein